MSEWFKKIDDDFYKEQAVEDRTLVETVKDKFYTYLTEQFLCSLPTLLFKFLIEKGVGHIFEPHPSLHRPPLNPNWAEKQKGWEKFIAERKWEYFLSQYTELSGISKASSRLWGGSCSYVEIKWSGF